MQTNMALKRRKRRPIAWLIVA